MDCRHQHPKRRGTPPELDTKLGTPLPLTSGIRSRRNSAPAEDTHVACLISRAPATITRPSHHVSADEEEAWVRLGIEFLAPQDREVLRLREWVQESSAVDKADHSRETA